MDDQVEIVTLRLRAVGALERPPIPRIAGGGGDASGALRGQRSVSRGEPGESADYDVYDRSGLRAGDVLAGPAIVEEPSSTTVIHEGDRLEVGEYGELVVHD
jgi:N-methylhydantoinase A